MLKNSTLLVECVGLPGAGKSTWCKSFSELLVKDNISVSTIKDLKLFVHNKSHFKKFLLLAKALILKGTGLMSFASFLIQSRVYSWDSAHRYLRISFYDIALKEFLKVKKTDVFLLDQWMIQEVWSATIFKFNSYKGLEEYFKKFFFETDCVLYFDVSVSVASERIEKRGTSFSRFDKMDSNHRIKMLEKHSSYLYQLYISSNCKNKHVISSEDLFERNDYRLYHYLIKYVAFKEMRV